MIYILADLEKEIDEVNQKFMKAFADRQYETIAELYTEDCMLMQPFSPTKVGRDSKNS